MTSPAGYTGSPYDLSFIYSIVNVNNYMHQVLASLRPVTVPLPSVPFSGSLVDFDAVRYMQNGKFLH
jgi:hypothetical protein